MFIFQNKFIIKNYWKLEKLILKINQGKILSFFSYIESLNSRILSSTFFFACIVFFHWLFSLLHQCFFFLNSFPTFKVWNSFYFLPLECLLKNIIWDSLRPESLIEKIYHCHFLLYSGLFVIFDIIWFIISLFIFAKSVLFSTLHIIA